MAIHGAVESNIMTTACSARQSGTEIMTRSIARTHTQTHTTLKTTVIPGTPLRPNRSPAHNTRKRYGDLFRLMSPKKHTRSSFGASINDHITIKTHQPARCLQVEAAKIRLFASFHAIKLRLFARERICTRIGSRDSSCPPFCGCDFFLGKTFLPIIYTIGVPAT